MQFSRLLIWAGLSILLAGFPVMAAAKTTGPGGQPHPVYANSEPSAVLRLVDHHDHHEGERDYWEHRHRDWNDYNRGYYGGYSPYYGHNYGYRPNPYGYGYAPYNPPPPYYYHHHGDRYKYRFFGHVFNKLFNAIRHG